LLAAGAPGKRATLRNARVLIHQPHGGAQGQSVDIEIWAREVVAQRDQMVNTLARHTGQTSERIAKDIDRDYIVRGADAVAYGLVDHVLEHRGVTAPGHFGNGQRPAT
jgi:ATP-dependent Clp protease protease subunit